jgi:hypothetical protein
LFYEFNNPNAPYTLRDHDFISKKGKKYKSAYVVYMTSADEYEAAMRLVGSMGHWRMLCGLKWFMEGLEHGSGRLAGLNQWRLDMAARDQSIAKKQLMEEAKNGSVTAQKEIYQTASKSLKASDKSPQKKKHSSSETNRVQALADRFKEQT